MKQIIFILESDKGDYVEGENYNVVNVKCFLKFNGKSEINVIYNYILLILPVILHVTIVD